MEIKNSKHLLPLIFIPLLCLIFIRPFVSGLAYPGFEFWYEIFIITLAIIILLIKLRKLPSKTCEVKYSWIPLFLLAYIISTITSVNIQNSIKETIKFLSYICVFFAVSQASDNQKNILIKTIVTGASIISIYTIYQFCFGYQQTLDYINKTNNAFFLTSSYAKDILISKRAIGTFPSPNIFGSYLLMAFFLSLTYIEPLSDLSDSVSRRARRLTESDRFYCAICTVIIVIALILTKSMGAWLSIITCLMIFFLMSYNNFKGKKIIFFASLIFAGIILAFIVINRWERLMNLENPQNSITQRLSYWRTAINVIKDHPFLGVGPGNFQEVFLKYKTGISTDTRYAHNIFLHQWAETGILGFSGMVYLIFNLFRKIRIQPAQKFICLAILAFILHNLIDNSYFIPETGLLCWALIGITLHFNIVTDVKLEYCASAKQTNHRPRIYGPKI